MSLRSLSMLRPARSRKSAAPGFTLIELMVTLALMAIMMVLAAPSFITFQRNSELTTTANSFLATLASARAEAMKRQLRTFVIPLTPGDWTSGWVAFVDVKSNVSTTALSSLSVSTLSSDSTSYIILSQVQGLPPSVAIDAPADSTSFVHGSVKYAMFNGSGFMSVIGGGFPAGGGDSLDFTNGTGQTRRVLASVAGRMRVCKPADASTLGDPGCSVGAF